MAVQDHKIIETPVIILLGPTAVGKTDLSLTMAELFDCEIISMDSMQVYRFMDIGTAKPSYEEQQRIPHHLIDIIYPTEQYNSALFVRDALAAIKSISAAGKIPLLTGGTGLYLKALLEGLFTLDDTGDESIRTRLETRFREEGREKLFAELRSIDPESAARIHVNDTQRLLRALEIYSATGKTWSSLLRDQTDPEVKFTAILHLGIACERRLLYDRIEKRAYAMVEEGLFAEAEKLQTMGYSPDLPAMQAIGYRHANNYLAGIWDREETVRLLIRDTRRYAKRQMTWFSRNPFIQWFSRYDRQAVLQQTEMWLACKRRQ